MKSDGMKYLSVCSGIEAATSAWHHMGWTPVAFSEIEPFPSAVLAHHYPDTPNWGDMTKFKEWPDADVDVLVGGTPCQSFSVAGLRKGLDDPRGNLMLTYLAIAAKYRPEWLVWENVPGVLSSNGGHDFASLLQGLGELGYGFAYRVLDAQYFGVAQRRRRVFVVASARGWQRAAAVLFERHSLLGHPAPSRETREAVAGGVANGTGSSGEPVAAKWPADVASTLNAAFGSKQGLKDQHALGGAPLFVPCPIFATDGQANAAFAEDMALTLNATHEAPYIVFKDATDLVACITGDVTHTLRAEGFDASEDGTGRGQPIVALAFKVRGGSETDTGSRGSQTVGKAAGKGYLGSEGDPMFTLQATKPHAVAQPIAFHPTQDPINSDDGSTHCLGTGNRHGAATVAVAQAVAPALTASNNPSRSPQSSEVTQQVAAVHAATMAVRRLTPEECEALQGFPRSYTDIPWRKQPTAPDGPRYKALGNSMAVPVMRWIGERIQQVNNIEG